MAVTLTPAITLHVISAIPALCIGAWQLLAAKGNNPHKLLGYIWVALMLIASISSFWITNIFQGKLSPIHLLSIVTIISITVALHAIRNNKIIRHKRSMIGAYFGLLGAFAFTFLPGRLMNHWLLSIFQ